MKAVKLFSLIIISLIALLLGLEGSLSAYYFQQNATERLAILHYKSEIANRYFFAGNLKRVGIWVSDESYGYRHRTDSSGRHTTAQYDVTYRIGSQGERLHSHSGSRAENEIVFLGGSCTFGQGVQSDQAFPSLLANEVLADWEVRNQAVMGWGTAHAYLQLRRELEAPDPPDVFVYCMIPHHLRRNYIRESWLQGLSHYGLKHPHFSLKDGKARFEGVVGAGDGLRSSKELRSTELAITIELLKAMQSECKQKDRVFQVVLLPKLRARDGWSPTLIRGLVDASVSFVDISHLELERFGSDRHPNSSDHKLIADQLKSELGPAWTELGHRR